PLSPSKPSPAVVHSFPLFFSVREAQSPRQIVDRF
ncbi:hypothetical protein Csa_023739, partial [Cucumis sativus]